MHRGAIIGVGKIAQTGHLPAFRDPAIRGRAEIVAGVDPDPESRALARERFPEIRLYAGIQEMLAQEAVDFVDICTPPVSHYRLMEAALGQGKHILCEKPLAISLEEAEAAADMLCRRKPAVVFMPCHQYRYSEVWRHMRAFVASLPPGEGGLVQFNIFRTGADPGILPRGSAWRIHGTISGGGILADTGVHYLSLSLWMMGVPRAVTARIHRLALREGEVEDTAVVLLEYEQRLVQITLTWTADRRTNSACLVSPAGGLFYDGKTLIKTKGPAEEVLAVPDASDKAHYIRMYVSLLDDFLQALETGKTSGPDLDEAQQSMRLLHACYVSARSGTRVSLESTP